MDDCEPSIGILATSSIILLLILDANREFLKAVENSIQNVILPNLLMLPFILERTTLPFDTLSQATLNHFRLWSSNFYLDEDLGFWIKSHSTTWFFQFLLYEYDDRQWVEMFSFTKRVIF